jgi:hypothetical protein
VNGGYFPEIHNCNVRSAKSYSITYDNSTAVDTFNNGTTFFNKQGFIEREEYKGLFGAKSYKYHYNDLGFLIQIDTNGLFGYGQGSNPDTVLTEHTKEYIRYCTEERLLRDIFVIKTDTIQFHTLYSYNSSGKVSKKTHLSGRNESTLAITSYVEYHYLVCGLISEELRLDSDMKIISRRVYEYEMY